MKFECHITCNQADGEKASAVATEHHWKTSEIARDPVLGAATFFYLTSHGASYQSIFRRMRTAVAALEAAGVSVVREKIEEIVYDTKTGIGAAEKVCTPQAELLREAREMLNDLNSAYGAPTISDLVERIDSALKL